MTSGTRGQVNALLDESARLLAEVKELYQSSLHLQTVTPALQVKIKSLLENQRSALEYVAHAIVEAHGKRGARTYFPVARTADQFPALFDRQMPGVSGNRPDIRDEIERHQPYWAGFEWMEYLVDLTNENKHQRLTPQVRTEVVQLAPGLGGGSFGRLGGPSIHMGEGASIRMSGGASISFGGTGPAFAQNITQTILVGFQFEAPAVSALGLLEEIQRSLPSVVDAVLASGDL